MKLLKVVNYEVEINDEAFMIPEFAALLTLAYNKQKGDHDGRKRFRGLKEFKLIYFLKDYASEFSNFTEDERLKAALSTLDLPEDYVFSEELKTALEKYEELQETRSLKLLKSARKVLDKARQFYEEVDFKEMDRNHRRVHNPKEIMQSISELDKAITALDNLERKIKEELSEDVAVVGDQERGFFN